ncbi:PXA domain-containing protein [Choanephora cucurbitarum]|nr:PXA domain-containing protein [Choanephora cucurbitarum]
MKKDTSLRPFHIRILFPDLLTLSKNDPRRFDTPKSITKSRAVDLELYTYFALLLRDFIHPWYKLLTTDEDLTREVRDILILIVQRLEKRLCEEVDWTELILVDLPNLLLIHYQDYRQAKKRLHMDHSSGCHSLTELFHGMQPHFALQPIENREKEYLGMLADSLLKILLRPQDYQSDCVRYLVRDILSNLVLFNAIDALTDPYTIHMIICKLLASYETTLDELEASGKFSETYYSASTNEQVKLKQQDHIISDNGSETPREEEKQLEGLTRQMQRLQEKRREKEGLDVMEDDLHPQTPPAEKPKGRKKFSFGYITLQVLLAPFHTLWLYVMATLTQSQERYQRVNQYKKRTRQIRLIEPSMDLIYNACRIEEKPVLQWTWQMIGMLFWPLIRVFGGALLVDKFLEQTVLHLLSEDHIVFYLRLGSDLLWPDGVFIQRTDPPTPLEKEQMRTRAERLLTVSIPEKVGTVMFNTKDLNELQDQIHDIVEPFQNKQINKHLIYLLVDHILAKVLPELLTSTNDSKK